MNKQGRPATDSKPRLFRNSTGQLYHSLGSEFDPYKFLLGLEYIWESDTLDIMDIHGHFWICMDMDMVDNQMDIQNGYTCWISMSIIDIQHGYHVWISITSMISSGRNCMQGWMRTI